MKDRFIALIIPPHVRALFRKLGLVWILLSVTRILFYLFNAASFPAAGLTDFLAGMWFDAISIGICFMPYYSLYLLPFPYRYNRFYKLFFEILFYGITGVMLVLNLMDVEYFKYTGKRSTADLFTILGAGNDLNQLLTSFIRDFWFLILFFIALLVLLIFLDRRMRKKPVPVSRREFLLSNVISFVIYMPLMIVIARGGFALRPVGLIEASKFTRVQNTALVMNTPFTMVKSFGKENLPEKHYMSAEQAEKLFNPVHTSHPQHLLPEKTNVMIIILESFGIEFVGKYPEGGAGYTPFLDSLLGESWYFEYAYANGKKSIEAMPAIVASIPSLMDNPYISSNYATNHIESLVDLLHKNGYTSAFFHGATNGSMRFDAFAAQAGYAHYFGRFEYNNDAHFDKTWGILDEYFNPWTARELSKLKEPFIGTLFTLSSHHPYFIPEHMRKRVKYGPQPICASISYGDYALQEFFREAKKQPWYDHTLFVICADHTPASTTPEFSQRTFLYRIPIAFYHPQGLLGKRKDERVMQQLDILPTVLDLLNIKTTYYSFGHSVFDDQPREAFAYLDGTYHYFQDRYLLNFANNETRNLFNCREFRQYPPDSLAQLPQQAKRYEQRLKALIQRYNNDLIKNETSVK